MLKGTLMKRWVRFLRVTALRGRRERPSARLGEDGEKTTDLQKLQKALKTFFYIMTKDCENGQNFTYTHRAVVGPAIGHRLAS